MKPRAAGLLAIPSTNRRHTDLPHDVGPACPGRGGQVGRPSVEDLVGQDGEGDGFFRVAVDTELGGPRRDAGKSREPKDMGRELGL